MNLLETLAKEHSRAQCDRIVKYIGKDPHRFKNLVEVFLAGPYRITQRAAWPLGNCVELHPELIKPHLKRIILNLKRPKLHDAVKRNTVRLLQFIDIPRSMQGTVTEICFNFFEGKKEPIAVRVFAMTVLANIAKYQPDLKNELRIMIEHQLPFGSAGFVSRARKVLRQLKT